MKKTRQESKSGKLLIFGGVYSNLQALEAIYEHALKMNIDADNIICTGDIVGYCAQPEEVVQFVKKWSINNIAGNVELQLAEGKDDCGCDFDSGSRCDLFSKQWYPFAQSALSEDSLDWIKELPEEIKFLWEGKEIGVVHGSSFETSEYIFKSSPWSVKQRNFDALEVDIILSGHSGLPFQERKDNKLWLNAGVIGMPANDGGTHVWFATMESKENKVVVEHHQLTYDHHKANAKMIEHKLPSAYAKTLMDGIWDNCEILPETETEQQGQKIKF